MRERWPLAPLTQEWNENNALLRLLPLTSDQTVELRRCSPVPLSISNVARGTVSVPQKQNCPFPSYVCGGNDSPRNTRRSHLDGFLCCVFFVSSHFHGWGGGGRQSFLFSQSTCPCVSLSHTLPHTRRKWARGAAGEEGEAFLGCPLFLNYILDPV